MEDEVKNPKNVNEQAQPSAQTIAEQDIQADADLNMDPDPTNDLDEGELAVFDNSDEKAFDALEGDRVIQELNKDEDVKPTA